MADIPDQRLNAMNLIWVFVFVAVTLVSGQVTSPQISSEERIIYQIFNVLPVIPISPNAAVEVTRFDSTRLLGYARLQVQAANRKIEILNDIDLPTTSSLIHPLEGAKAEWEVVVDRFEKAEGVRLAARAALIEKERKLNERELYYLQQELNIAKLRLLGANDKADRLELDLRHQQLTDPILKNR
ncbi:hypothetical protein KJZ99_11080 [bacterium]|nr:hypothetical protein [bacterium]